ncbi:two-component system sensor histidine kinase AtoS [Desulfoscipio sp. XC116]|uniref:two-component system sensor histidine kinase AtoS n=1 Tax=Desulfoscipio sp. XC116 TaxID=3144975 RepID=UPI00325B570F
MRLMPVRFTLLPRIRIRYEGFTNQLLILVAILLMIPILLSVYLFHMVHSTELGMIRNHRENLEEAMNYLDDSLNSSFANILSSKEVRGLPRRDQENYLNQALSPIVERARNKYPGVDLGFYSVDFDVILDGNNEHLHENFSTRRKRYFDDALQNNQMIYEVLGQSGTGQLETYQPLVRDGKIIGLVWANENIKGIYKTVDDIQRVVYGIIFIGALLGFGGAFSLVNKFARNVNDIKKGLGVMGSDPAFILPEATGELGQITEAINEMYKKLINVEKYNDLILTSIDDGIITIDNNEKIISINSAAGRMLNLDEYCIDKTIGEVLPGSPFTHYLKNTLKGRPVKDLNAVDIVPGSSRHLLINTSQMYNVRQELVGALLHFRDITEIVRLQESFNRQERLAALGKLVAGVAHEIRSPLTSITGYLQFWNRGHAPSAKSLNIVNRELYRLSSLTDQLLEFARPSKAVFVEYDLNSLVNRLVQFFSDAYSGKLEILCRPDENLPPALLDPHQIEQVLTNILYNSYQVMEGRGRLEISTWLDDKTGMLGVAVRDHGSGIPEAVIPHIFEPFFTTKSKGTGLGLAIAHEIMEAHNGKIQVESRVNEGTTVTLYLPQAGRGDTDVKSIDR